MSKKVNEKLSEAQTSKECLIVNCDKGGRLIGRLGEIELTYCGHHRKYGERILNFLIRAAFGDRMKDFLSETKDDLFMKNMPELSEHSYQVLSEYVNDMIHKLDEVEEWHEKTK